MRVSLLICLMLAAATTTRGQTYIEDFTTDAFKDAGATTADWNTADGQLKLFPFEASLQGSVDTSGDAWDLAVHGNYVFVADNTSGVQVIDITDTSNPTIVATYTTLSGAGGVAVDGDLLFVAVFGAGLEIVDITDPTNPTFVSTIDTFDWAFDLVVDGNSVFIADLADGLQIVDITNPASPALLGRYNTPGYAQEVEVHGDIAFVADGPGGLQIIDVSDLSNPVLLGSFDTPGDARSVSVDGDLAIVSDGYGGILLFNVSDPTAPSLVSSFPTPQDANETAIAGNAVYVADGTNGVAVIDITDPSNPVLTRTIESLGNANGIEMFGDICIIVADTEGLQLLRVSEFSDPELLGGYETDRAERVAVSGDLAIVADFYSGIRIFDISNPTNPILLSSMDTPGEALDVAVAGDHVFVADTSAGIQVISINDPLNPVIVGNYDTPSWAYGVTVSGPFAFVADGPNGLVILDIEDPTAPTPIATFSTSGDAREVVVAGDLAIVACYFTGLEVVDISNLAMPTSLGSLAEFANWTGLAVSGDLVFGAATSSGLQIVDISDPTAPSIVGTLAEPNWAEQVCVAGDLAFVAGSLWGFQVVDIRNPNDPVSLTIIGTPSRINDVVIAGELAVMAADDAGVQIYQPFQSQLDVSNNFAQSSSIVSPATPITSVGLAANQSGNVTWEVTVDGGMNWQAINSNGAAIVLETPGTDLRWRCHLRGHLIAPSVDSVQLSYSIGYPSCPSSSVLYVNASASTNSDGSSWQNALTDLQFALAVADTCPGISEIWVAKGIYYPTWGLDPTATFQLLDGVGIYGGFRGTESQRSQRDWKLNETVLSGDLGTPGDDFDNSYHIVTGSGTGPTAVLDGFTVTTGGFFLTQGEPRNYGGGMYNDAGSPTVRNCGFRDHHSTNGSAMGNFNGSSPTLDHVRFEFNQSALVGGAMYNSDSGPTMTKVDFVRNQSDNTTGGAIFHGGNLPMYLRDCTFIDNFAFGDAGAILMNGNSVFENVSFRGNSTPSSGAGGCIRSSGSPIFRNVLFANNGGGRDAGAFRNAGGNPVFINVTFTQNGIVGDQTGAGALYNDGGHPILINVISWSNFNAHPSSGWPTEIYSTNGGTCEISYSLIDGCGGSGAGWDATLGIDGGNNIDADPLFVDPINHNYALSPGSPAINAGNNSVVTLDVDLGGACQRILDDVVDLGPYEFSEIVINEFSPTTPGQEFVEIRNLSSGVVDLTAYRLRHDTGTTTTEEALPAGSTIPAGGLLVYTFQTIVLNDLGGTLGLFAPVGMYCLDEVSYGFAGGAPTVPAQFTTSRVEGTGVGVADDLAFELGDPTPSADNLTATPDLGGSIVFNEVLYTAGSPGDPDYIELYNPQGTPATLSHFYLGFGDESLVSLNDSGVILQPGQRYLLEQGTAGSFDQDIETGILYLYRVDGEARLQRVDQLSWIPKVPGTSIPGPGGPGSDALSRVPDGSAVYEGDRGANWEECGGEGWLFYGSRSPGLPNVAPDASSYSVDPGGGGNFSDIASALSHVAANSDADGNWILLDAADYQESVVLPRDVQIAGVVDPLLPAVIATLSGPLGGGSSIVTSSDYQIASTITGIAIAGGTAVQGAGLSITSGRPVFRSVVFDGNQATGSGGAVAILGGSPVFEGCIFRNNSAVTSGGAVYVSGSSSRVTFRNCVFVGNLANSGASIFVAGGEVTVEHCIFDQNETLSSSSADLHNSSSVGSIAVEFSIITNTIGGGALKNGGDGSDFTFDCGAIYGSSGMPTSGITPTRVIEADPLFCDVGSGDYRFEASSPLLDIVIGCRERAGMEGPCTAFPVSVPEVLPVRNVLHPPAPNPFNPSTRLRFELARSGKVTLDLYDLKGRRIARIVDNATLPAGMHETSWPGLDVRGKSVSSGVYFASLSVDGEVVAPARRLVLVK